MREYRHHLRSPGRRPKLRRVRRTFSIRSAGSRLGLPFEGVFYSVTSPWFGLNQRLRLLGVGGPALPARKSTARQDPVVHFLSVHRHPNVSATHLCSRRARSDLRLPSDLGERRRPRPSGNSRTKPPSSRRRDSFVSATSTDTHRLELFRPLTREAPPTGSGRRPVPDARGLILPWSSPSSSFGHRQAWIGSASSPSRRPQSQFRRPRARR